MVSYLRFVLFAVCVSCTTLFTSLQGGEVVETFYGSIEVNEPVILALIESEPMQRLKEVHQYGVMAKVTPMETYTRYEHSLGVWALLRQFGAELDEQIAGLLHDVSHTTFSHVGDWVFEHHNEESAYQDDIHEAFLHEVGIGDILVEHGLKVKDVLHKNPNFVAMDCKLPMMCADRIEYNIQGGYLRGLISKKEVQEIVAALHFDGKQWYFSSQKAARIFAELPLEMTMNVWGSSENIACNYWAAQALQAAVRSEDITLDDILHGKDDEVWKQLQDSSSTEVQTYMNYLENHSHLIALTGKHTAQTMIYAKFRGIDPLVRVGEELLPLSKIDSEFSVYFARVKKLMHDGWSMALSEPVLPSTLPEGRNQPVVENRAA